jgi:hypothetical protein
LSWPWTVIFLISTSQVAGIIFLLLSSSNSFSILEEVFLTSVQFHASVLKNLLSLYWAGVS